MFVGSLKHPKTYAQMLVQPVWRQVFDWLKRENLVEKAAGDYEISEKDVFASVQTIQTVPRSEGIFEAHRKYIDVHYCISGSERIEWAPVNTLTATQEFDTTKDYGLYAVPEQTTSILLTPGNFAIFLPEDAHMPKIQSGIGSETKKVVVKVPASVL